MRYADITARLSGLGGQKWAVHAKARAKAASGTSVIELTIGEPDVETPVELMQTAIAAMQAGRTGYSNGQGEPGLIKALAERYTQRRGRLIQPEQVMSFPGTQTTLYAVLTGLVQAGDEVLVGDPLYATYEGLIAATGATAIRVPLRADRGFRIDPADIAARVTAATRLIFLNTPHNPTGAVLSKADLAAVGEIALAHDLWILSDEVYEDLVYQGTTFTSALDLPELAERVIVASSISKSHAAPGFRSGWCIGPAEFVQALLPLSETMLFGNQPFIADMTAAAVAKPSPVAPGMCARFARRAALLHDRLDGSAGMRVHRPQAGMFALIDIRDSGLTGEMFALRLLEQESVAMMPGESFGESLSGWLRVALTQDDALIAEACTRIIRFSSQLQGKAA